MRRSANTWRGSDAALSIDPAEEAGLYVRSLDEFFIEARLAGLWHGGLSEGSEQRLSLHHQAGDIERILVGTAGEAAADADDVITMSSPDGEHPQTIAFYDAVEGRSAIAPSATFGGGGSSDWMLTLLPSADWVDFPGSAADPWA